MLFDHCAQCQRCCVVDAGHPPLEISLTKSETKRLGSVCIERSCEHLGSRGCTLDDKKPFACQLYPLSFDPEQRQFHFDAECPLMPAYVAQLAVPNSDAAMHLAKVSSVIRQLQKKDAAFLTSNFEVDVDYFDLHPIPHPPL